ncbi:unnamed protein product [Moneuplotes crassus]|uniref:Uncharacterized protein n=1 Tax=Euplotes crassus TaxID=5936 RepID=A0AAD1XRL0_EUPCR|nr:unnamed protein product [Moneuplotes crassus]
MLKKRRKKSSHNAHTKSYKISNTTLSLPNSSFKANRTIPSVPIEFLLKAISPRQYDKVIAKYNKSRKKGKQPLYPKNIFAELDLGAAQEIEKSSREYEYILRCKQKSFMARMNEDVYKRQKRHKNLCKDHVNTRGNNHASLSWERAVQLSDRLYKEGNKSLISTSQIRCDAHTLRHNTPYSFSSPIHHTPSPPKNFTKILHRMKSKDTAAKIQILNLRKSKRHFEHNQAQKLLNQNISNGKMPKTQFEKLQRKFEEDIEKRKREYDEEIDRKCKRFEEEVKDMFKPKLGKSKRSLGKLRKRELLLKSLGKAFCQKRVLRKVTMPVELLKKSTQKASQQLKSPNERINVKRGSMKKSKQNKILYHYLTKTPKERNRDLTYLRDSSSKKIRNFEILKQNETVQERDITKKLKLTEDTLEDRAESREEHACFTKSESKNSPLDHSSQTKEDEFEDFKCTNHPKKMKLANHRPPKSKKIKVRQKVDRNALPSYLSPTESSSRACRVKYTSSESIRNRKNNLISSEHFSLSNKSKKRSIPRTKKFKEDHFSFSFSQVVSPVSKPRKPRAASANSQRSSHKFTLSSLDKEKYEKSRQNFEQYRLKNL